MKYLIAIPLLCLMVTACAGSSSKSVAVMQKKDKNLGCTDVLLEMNEAEFYGKMAEDNKGLNVNNVISPLGYMDTYMSAEKAIKNANSRIAYLTKVYEILKCDQQEAMQAAYPVQAPMIAAPVSGYYGAAYVAQQPAYTAEGYAIGYPQQPHAIQ